jgi:DNA-binding MarR family transcriptional regulator
MSRYLMVTGGNVTGLADELEKEALVERVTDPNDRRSSRVSLTKKGRKRFDALAAEHESWIITMFSGMPKAEMTQLYDLLGRLRVQLAEPSAPAVSPPPTPRRRARRSEALT